MKASSPLFKRQDVFYNEKTARIIPHGTSTKISETFFFSWRWQFKTIFTQNNNTKWDTEVISDFLKSYDFWVKSHFKSYSIVHIEFSWPRKTQETPIQNIFSSNITQTRETTIPLFSCLLCSLYVGSKKWVCNEKAHCAVLWDKC